MHQDCDECTRLWSEYALATRHYLKLAGRFQIADVSQDEKSVAELSPLVQSAAAERSNLRHQIDAHTSEGRTALGAA